MGLLDEWKKSLPCELTQDEFEKKGKRIDKVVKDLVKLEAQKAEVVKEFKEKIDKLEVERDLLAKQLGDKAEERFVEVKWKCSPDQARKELIRLDTKETVEKQTMTTAEIAEVTQGKLPLDKDASKH